MLFLKCTGGTFIALYQLDHSKFCFDHCNSKPNLIECGNKDGNYHNERYIGFSAQWGDISLPLVAG